MLGKPSPEKALKEVEIYLANINVPNHTTIQALKKGIESFSNNIDLKEKLKEIETNTDTAISQTSPKTLYGTLVILISIMGSGLLLSYFTGNANSFALFIGASFSQVLL